MATVSIEYFGMNGTGRNVTEAKRDAGRKLEQAMSGNYSPKILSSRGWIVLIWRDPNGWRHSTIQDEDGPRSDVHYSSGNEYSDALFSALLHLAQMSWDGQEAIPPILAECPGRTDTYRRLLGEFKHWRGFQLAYRHAKATEPEKGDTHWHHWACEHTSEFAA